MTALCSLTRRLPRRRYWVLTVLLALITTPGGLPAQASASRFRRLDGNAIAFATDGARYAAWQYRESFPIIVFDTRTGHRGEIENGCALDGSGPYQRAAAGRFLVHCGRGPALLDVRTGAVTTLPTGEYGPAWDAVGRRYVSGPAELHARCHRTKRHEGCTAIYNIATGAVTEVPESDVPDLDRPGAPPVCQPLRKKLFRLEREGFDELFSYSDGFLAEAAERVHEGPILRVRMEGCHGPPTIVHAPSEPEHVELRGGLLTWDTGHRGESFDSEEGEGIDTLHATLTSYRLATREHRSWHLPVLPLDASIKGESRPVLGVFGYSAHTDYALFWIAARSLGCGEKGLCNVDTWYVYSARL